MAINPTDFKVRYPEFVAIDDARIQQYLDDALLEVQEASWGELHERGVFTLAAHYLYIGNQTSSGGAVPVGTVSSKSVGDVSISFATGAPPATMASALSESRYGADYLRLMRLVGITAIAVSNYG